MQSTGTVPQKCIFWGFMWTPLQAWMVGKQHLVEFNSSFKSTWCDIQSSHSSSADCLRVSVCSSVEWCNHRLVFFTPWPSVVAQRGCGCPVSGFGHGRPGQPDLGGDIPGHGKVREVGNRGSLRYLPTESILWFYDWTKRCEDKLRNLCRGGGGEMEGLFLCFYE